MSFAIPGLTSVEVTASVPKYAWKQYVINSKQIPVAGTWYTVLDESGGVELRKLILSADDDEEDTKDMEVRITIDGEVWTSGIIAAQWQTNEDISVYTLAGDPFTIVPVSGSLYSNAAANFGFNNFGQGAAAGDRATSPFMSGHAIKVEVRQTEAVGTNPFILYLLAYAKKEAV